MSTSLSVVEAEFTAESAHLVLELRDDRQVAEIGEHLSGIFERAQELSCRIETVGDLARRLDAAGLGHPSRLERPCDIAAPVTVSS